MAYVDILNPNHPASFVTMSGGKVVPRDNRAISGVPLADKKNVFMAHVGTHYSAPTIRNYHWCVNMVVNSGTRGFLTYNRLLEKYPQRHIRCYIIQTMLYDFYDVLPPAGRLNLNACFYKLTLENQRFVEDLMMCELARKLAPSSVSLDASHVCAFLRYMEDCGVTDIHDVSDRMIQEYAYINGTEAIIIHRVGNSLKYYAEMHSDEKLLSIVALFPPCLKKKKVYRPMLSDERRKFEEYVNDPSSPLSRRDRAVCNLILYTGIRASDVRKLRLTDVNLADCSIHVVQQKTGSHLALPMIPVVSNAIVDYVRNERVPNGSPLLFQPSGTGQKARDGKQTMCDVTRIVNKVYDAAGIRGKGMKRGTHILRHAAADAMINNGDDLAVISRVLGHKDPKTTLGYINANVEQLRACALPIAKYPVNSPLYAE